MKLIESLLIESLVIYIKYSILVGSSLSAEQRNQREGKVISIIMMYVCKFVMLLVLQCSGKAIFVWRQNTW